MGQDDLLRFAVAVLDRLALRYFITGSIATVYFGEPRFTNDIDIVVDLEPRKIDALCAAFPPADFYLSDETVRRAVRQCSQFNVIHPASGLKLDMMVAADTLFNRSRFQRALRVRPIADCEAFFSSAEDLILKKMEFFREGGSEKHLRDIAGILRISDGLDEEYIESWADHLGLETLWRTLVRRVTAESESSLSES